MWKTVELHEIRTFLVLSEELHFGRAAERLCLTQSRVSQIVRTLEHRIGGALFERTSRRVTLTPLGQQLCNMIEGPYAAIQQVFATIEVSAQGITAPLSIGLASIVSRGPCWRDIVEVFQRRYPNCEVREVEVNLDTDMLAPLRGGHVDIMAFRLPVQQPDITVGPVLVTEERMLAVAETHPLARRESVSYEDLAGEQVIEVAGMPPEAYHNMIPERTPSGKPIVRYSRKVATIVDILNLVAHGVIVHPTVASLADYFRFPGVTFVPVTETPPSRAGLIWVTGRLTPGAEAFAMVARQILESESIQ